METMRRDGVRNGCEEQITGQCKQEVVSQAFPEQRCRDLPQIVVYQETDHPPKEEETVYEVRKETKVFRWFQRVQLPRGAGYIGIYDENRTDQADQRKVSGYIFIKGIHDALLSHCKEKQNNDSLFCNVMSKRKKKHKSETFSFFQHKYDIVST